MYLTLGQLVARSRRLGADRSVCNWGGGNTSAKSTELDFRGRSTRVLWVKGSGSDLATCSEASFTGLLLDELLPLAKLPNVAIKATGAPGYSKDAYPFPDIQDGLHRIFDAYGPDRFFWGTDITRMPCSYRQCVTFFTEELPWLTGQDLEKVMGRALCAWIGWDYAFEPRPTHVESSTSSRRGMDK